MSGKVILGRFLTGFTGHGSLQVATTSVNEVLDSFDLEVRCSLN